MQGWSISPNFLSYSISKLALKEAIPLLARDLAPCVRVNGLALAATLPGVLDDAKTFDKIADFTPLQRTSEVQEVVDAMQYLLTAYSTTGHVLDLSNGMQTYHTLLSRHTTSSCD